MKARGYLKGSDLYSLFTLVYYTFENVTEESETDKKPNKYNIIRNHEVRTNNASFLRW